MILHRVIRIFGAAFAAPLSLWAQEFKMELPVDCNLETQCYIQQFMDHDPSSKASDMRCGHLTYDGHTGTDFAIRDPRLHPNGVNVIASASGTIKALRDDMPDIAYTSARAQELVGKACGNGIVITHDRGWETQYCHLKQGSISVKVGDRVQTGAVLGKIGLSGRTQFPHVHVSVRRDGTRIDPFAPSGRLSCNASADTLWNIPVEYDEGGLLSLRFFDHLPKIETLRFGHDTDPITNQSPAIVIATFGFGVQKNDTLRLRIDGPRTTLFEHNVTMDRNQAQFMRSGGKKLTRRTWRSGDYHATATMVRDGRIISELKSVITVP